MIISMRKPLDASKTRREQGKKGFTLTEIAIVLGIVGLILGAIWVAAAAVYNNLRVSKATTELLTVAQNVRAMYATSTAVDASANMIVTNPQATLTYINSGVFPSDMVSGASVLNPWGGSAAITAGTITSANDAFVISFDRVPQSACIGLLVSNTGNGRDSGLYTAAAGTGGAIAVTALTATTFPMLANTANTLCANTTAGVYNNVAFAFRLRG